MENDKATVVVNSSIYFDQVRVIIPEWLWGTPTLPEIIKKCIESAFEKEQADDLN